MRLALALPLVLSALPALAEEPVSAAEFEALVEGRTLTYGAAGTEPYGVEHYHPGRRVTWSWIGPGAVAGECHAGTWYAEGPEDAPAICFVYDDAPEDPKCWRVFREGDALRAEFLGDGGETVLYELAEDAGGLVCGGVGV